MNPARQDHEHQAGRAADPGSAVVMHGVLAFGTVLFVVLSALFVADSS